MQCNHLIPFLVALASLSVVCSSPIVKREGADETVGGFGLDDIIAVEFLGFGYQDLTFRAREVSDRGDSEAKAIAKDFDKLTFDELKNVKALEPLVTAQVVDLDQYPIVIAEFDLGILERAFLHEITRKKGVFRKHKETVGKGIKQQLEVLDIFQRISKDFGPNVVRGLDPITETRRASLKRALADFS